MVFGRIDTGEGQQEGYESCENDEPHLTADETQNKTGLPSDDL
jgi:hypothetical protein